MKPSLISWQTYTRIVGNLAGQKKYSAILLTINEKGFAHRFLGERLGGRKNDISAAFCHFGDKIVIEKQRDSIRFGMLY